VNPLERRKAIIEYLDTVGVCMYQDLAQRLGVSEMTIRRDIDKLVPRGGVIKTLGGVQTAHASPQLYESPIQQRLPIHRAEKEQIAHEGLRAIQSHQTVFLDGSTTCLVFARQIAKRLSGLTVITHSAMVCMEFGRVAENANSVLMLGGQFDPAGACFVGPTAEEAAQRFFVDVAFFSTKGFLPDEGTFESSIATIRIKQLIAEQAAQVVLLVDHSKFGQRALCKALNLSQIDEVVTDAGVSVADRMSLQRRGVTVRVGAEDRVPQETVSHAS
jgi:DeoR/GlpR family transcriptional regulator of sugar metabolism